MAGDEDPKEFPDVSQKLSAPKKQSAFERERQAAEEKKRREQAENAAALREFEESFADQGNDDDFDGFPGFQGLPTGPRAPGMGFGGPPGRFGGYGAPPRSGPGSLGPAPSIQPPSLGRKRALDEMRELQEAKRDQEDFTAGYMGRSKTKEARDVNDRDEEEQDIAPRPTVQLSSLPPSFTEDDVKALLSGHLHVHSVQIQTPSGPTYTGRKSLSAIAQLSPDTSTQDIEKTVTTLKEKYLGCGFRLSISRHLSSTSLQPNMPVAISGVSADPFGAQKVNRDQPSRFNMRNVAPPSFGPPGSYDAPVQSVIPANAIVTVQPPLEMNTLRAVHTIVDRLLSEPDPGRALEIEAMLMALPEIQTDERFSFLYNSRSPAGVYYRFLLWSDDALDTVQARKSPDKGPERVFDDVLIDWLPPFGEVPFADLSSLGDVLDHENYPSNDESDYGEDDEHFENGDENGKPLESPDNSRLTPLQVAKLSWMLSRMPKTHTLLDKGQVAAITSFAIKHARVGAEEIVNMMVLNIEKPYINTLCATFEEQDTSQGEDDDYEPNEQLPSIESTAPPDARGDKTESEDPSQVKVVALYLINDILHSCATASAKNAWKYRQLFENAFRQHKTFQHLGQLEKELGWGRIRANRWKAMIEALFKIWEQGNIFTADSFVALKNDFAAQQSRGDNAESEVTEEAKKREEKLLSRFKRIDGLVASPAGSASPAPAPPTRSESVAAETSELDGQPMDDADDLGGVPMDDDDLAGVPMDDDDLAGVPMDDDLDGTPMDDLPMPDAPTETVTSTAQSKTAGFSIKGSNGAKPPAAEPPKRRKLAEDMFADSDED